MICLAMSNMPASPDPTIQAAFHVSFPATFEEISITLVHIRQEFISCLGFDCGSLWELALAECLNNIAEHAYSDQAGNIDLWLLQSEKCLTVSIRDHGKAMPGGCLPDGDLPSLDKPLVDLPEGGFGWHLLHTTTENLRYHRNNRENWTRFDISLTK